jgi:hypothetical protein
MVMAKFKYVGSDAFSKDDPLPYYGVVFHLGKVTEVTDPNYVEKLRKIPAFEEVPDDKDEPAIDYKSVATPKQSGRGPGPKR